MSFEDSFDLPKILAVLYVAASAITFLAYAVDKSAARRGDWRIKERSLLLLGLAGGWPGGLLAQALLRHKTRKLSFLWKFWLTVALNLGVLVYLYASYPGGAAR